MSGVQPMCNPPGPRAVVFTSSEPSSPRQSRRANLQEPSTDYDAASVYFETGITGTAKHQSTKPNLSAPDLIMGPEAAFAWQFDIIDRFSGRLPMLEDKHVMKIEPELSQYGAAVTRDLLMHQTTMNEESDSQRFPSYCEATAAALFRQRRASSGVESGFAFAVRPDTQEYEPSEWQSSK